jgi:ribosomal-protein-alanine N-acetyltransferase
VLIRAASPDDVATIHALEQRADTAAHWTGREYEALFAQDAPRRLALVAVEGDSTLGFVIARCALDEWEIENVVVASEARNRGLASALLRHLLDRARSAGATSVLLEVRQSNLAALRLYEKQGFTLQGRRPNYYRDPVDDALLLHFSITAL